MRVPGLLGGVLYDVSITLHDMTGNGRPDMVFLYSDGIKGKAAIFYSVGINLDRNGTFTGGWSNHMCVPLTIAHVNPDYVIMGIKGSYSGTLTRNVSKLGTRWTKVISTGVAIAEFFKGKPAVMFSLSKLTIYVRYFLTYDPAGG